MNLFAGASAQILLLKLSSVLQAVYYGLRVNVLVLREAAQKAVAEKRAMEAKAAQAASRESPSNPPQQTPEVKAEPPQGTAAIPQMPTPTTGKNRPQALSSSHFLLHSVHRQET